LGLTVCLLMRTSGWRVRFTSTVPHAVQHLVALMCSASTGIWPIMTKEQETAAPGQSILILGKSGSGKSSRGILRCLGDLVFRENCLIILDGANDPFMLWAVVVLSVAAGRTVTFVSDNPLIKSAKIDLFRATGGGELSVLEAVNLITSAGYVPTGKRYGEGYHFVATVYG
jgi:energy-coupling factor transporter ATP-binding protein EcfA2